MQLGRIDKEEAIGGLRVEVGLAVEGTALWKMRFGGLNRGWLKDWGLGGGSFCTGY